MITHTRQDTTAHWSLLMVSKRLLEQLDLLKQLTVAPPRPHRGYSHLIHYQLRLTQPPPQMRYLRQLAYTMYRQEKSHWHMQQYLSGSMRDSGSVKTRASMGTWVLGHHPQSLSPAQRIVVWDLFVQSSRVVQAIADTVRGLPANARSL